MKTTGFWLPSKQLRLAGEGNARIILEPIGRNTAPAVALAALQSVARGEDDTLLVLAADHLIGDSAAFHESVNDALPLAESGKLVTFGIVPGKVENGYGHIQKGAALDTGGFVVERFVEKPDYATALNYLESGDYLWNSRMFLFKASRYLEKLERFRPDILEACRTALESSAKDLHFTRVDHGAFSACPEESVDYEVMEKTSSAAVVPMDAGWSDIGSWSAL